MWFHVAPRTSTRNLLEAFFLTCSNATPTVQRVIQDGGHAAVKTFLATLLPLLACQSAPPPVLPSAPIPVVVTLPPREPEAPTLPAQPSVRESTRRLMHDTLGALLAHMNVSADEGVRVV